MSENNIDPILTDLVNADPAELGNYSLEALILLINTERLRTLREATKKELEDLKKRQGDVKHLHECLRATNTATDEKGKLDLSKNPELKELLKKAKALGVELKEDKTSYSKEERDRLIENLRIAADDLNVENDLQLQTITKLTNERYESYQMARSILKPLSEAKQRMARDISGRG